MVAAHSNLSKIILLILLSWSASECVDVTTSSGVVRGTTLNVLGQRVNQFLGIPYAEPPLGDLRFNKPKPLTKPIEGVIDATKFKYSCIQDEHHYEGLIISEDCLFLNVWAQASNNRTHLKPVMVWIFGGGLTYGTIFLPKYNGSVLATHDVVYAAINYRSNWFGFLYANQTSAPGNVGFFDQVMGLQWIRDNIHLFGGNKNRVMIFGSSAGSQSVSALVLSPVANGLFKRAILESGSVLFNKKMPMISKDEAYGNARRMARQLNCSDDNTWVECLRKVEAKKFLPLVPSGLYPQEGTEFLPYSAQEAFDRREFNSDLDLICGVSSDEGTTFNNAYPDLDNKSVITAEDFHIFIGRMRPTTYHLLDDVNATEVVNFYLKNTDPNDSKAIRWRIYDFAGDLIFKCPTYLFAKRYAEQSSSKNNVFFYELTHSAKPPEYQEKNGISHDALSMFVFGLLHFENDTLPENIKLSDEIMRLWTNLAKYGTPDRKWPELIDRNRSHSATIVKDLNPFKLNKYFYNLFRNTCDGFWKDLYL